MLLLALSLAALAVGPALAVLSKNQPRLLEVLDGFVVVTIVGIVMLHVVPHALAELGLRAVVPFALGLLLPSWLERSRRSSSRLFGVAALLVLGLSLHAFLDGIALNTHDGHAHGAHSLGDGSVLAVAVSLHRIPEGLAVWWIVAGTRGARVGAFALTVVAAASCAGFLVSEPLAERIPEAGLVAFEVLVAGSLLHVVAHHELVRRRDVGHAHTTNRSHVHEGSAMASGFGAFVGTSFLFVITRQHPITYRVARELGFGTTLQALALSSAPALLLALVVSSLLHAFGPRVYAPLLSSRGPTRSRVGDAARGVVAGALLPICSCGVLPFYRRAATSGEPNGATIALLASAPEMELASILLSALLIDPVFAIVRPLTSAAVGCMSGAIVGSSSPSQAQLVLTLNEDRADLRRGIRFALGETVDHTGPWVVLGLFVAALVEPFVSPITIRSVPLVILVPSLALVGTFVPMCASGVTPLLAVLVHKGIGPGALLAFLVMAAAGNVRVLRLLASVHGRAVAVRYAVTLFAGAIAFGTAGTFFWRDGLETTLHGAARAGGGALGWASLVALIALFGVAVLRRGPRPLLLELIGGHLESRTERRS